MTNAVGESSATALALVIHELATNSMKYGALGNPTGILDVACTATDDDIVIVWTERGGPHVVAPVAPGGFGSTLIRRSMSAQLGGGIDYEWDEMGLIVILRASKIKLAR